MRSERNLDPKRLAIPTCGVCGLRHVELGAWTFRRPDYWRDLMEEQRARGMASDDLCRTADGHFFVRCVLSLPLLDGPHEEFEFGVWCSLSEANFRLYVETFNDPNQGKLEPMFGYLSNEIKQFPGSRGLKANVQPRDDNERPSVHLHATGDAEHPLYLAQARGIRYAAALAIVHEQDLFIEPPGPSAPRG